MIFDADGRRMTEQEIINTSQKIATEAEEEGWNPEWIIQPKTNLKLSILRHADPCLTKRLAITDDEHETIKQRAYELYDPENSYLNR